MKLNNLTLEEKRVIQEKGTETPFTGEYEKHKELGVYICRQCDAYLYRSSDKFESECGWPSFDDEIDGSVQKTLDADGSRTEITCSRCRGHLGHIFKGEHLTDTNTRHCVNSVSMKFVDELDVSKESRICLGGGCFWCLEAVFKTLPGVILVTSGYAGGEEKDSIYDRVCSGETDHAEVIEIIFDPTRVSLEKVLELFFDSHDPTSLNRQGNDVGRQYRSIILCDSKVQKEIVESYVERIAQIFTEPIVDEVVLLDVFYKAEAEHQDYFKNNPEKAYCQIVIAPKVEKAKKHLG